MNVEETIALIECLKSQGATHFKSRDFEVCLRRGKLVRQVPKTQMPKQRVSPPPQQAELPSVANAEDTEKAEELIRTLRNPEKLMDAIFPDGAEGGF